ncbi:MAG: argininosuccinate lyase, partial [Nitrosospira sp.]|nr:argininosuccinate lyase [Nitrosospira sp.]
TVDTLTDKLSIYADILTGVRVNQDAMRNAAMRGYATATDLADYLTKKGLPFREAHEAVAQVVRLADNSDRELSALTLPELKKFSELIDNDIFTVLTLEGSISSRNHIGGTAPAQVRAAIGRARKWLS